MLNPGPKGRGHRVALSAPLRWHRRASLALLAIVTATSPGCKNRKQSLAPVSFDPVAAAELDEGDRYSAPVWEEVERSLLGNGLLVHSLRERGSEALRLRLLLPTQRDADPPDALTLAVVERSLEEALQRGLRSTGARVATRPGPGRVELIIRVPRGDPAQLLAKLGEAMGQEPSLRRLEALANEELAALRRLSAVDAARAYCAARLLGLPPRHLLPIASDPDPAALRRAWRELTDPRELLLVLHTGRGLTDEALARGLDTLAERWGAAGPRLRPPSSSALERMRAELPPSPSKAFIAAAPAARLWALQNLQLPPRSSAQLVMARRIDTPTPEDRARARLAQRLLQQEVDAQLVVSGSTSVLLLSTRLSTSDPATSIKRLLESVEALSKEPIAPQRLTQAARIWLGARVVRASLEGEDWTGLWAEALDLTDRDELAGAALAVDAKRMLEVTPADLQAFAARWFRPRGGEPGWVWTTAGASEGTLNALGELTKIETLSVE